MNEAENFDDDMNSMMAEIQNSFPAAIPLPTDVSTRYKQAEDTFYEQMRETQFILSGMLQSAESKDIRAMAAVSKDLLNNYNETVRLRKLSEIESGSYVPVSVISSYQKDVFPAIAAGIDNLRMDILNHIAPATRPEFEAAWKIGYKKFVVAIKEAADKLEGYMEQARLEATGVSAKKQANNTKSSDKMSERRKQTAAAKRNKKNN